MAAKKPHLGLARMLADASQRAGRTLACKTDGCNTTYPLGRRCPVCHPVQRRDPMEMVARMQREIRALERHAIEDPAMLAQILVLVEQLSEVANVVVAVSSDTHKADPLSAPSMNECAAVMGMEPQSAYKRVVKGQSIIWARLKAVGVDSFALAAREREAREAAARHAAAKMPEWTTQRGHLRSVS